MQRTAHSWRPSNLPCCMLQQSRQVNAEKRLCCCCCRRRLWLLLLLLLMKMKLRLPQAEADKMMTLTMAHIMRIISQRIRVSSGASAKSQALYCLSCVSLCLLLLHCTSHSPRVPLDRTSLSLTVMFACGLRGAPNPLPPFPSTR